MLFRSLDLAVRISADGAESVTLLAGEDLSDADLETLASRIEQRLPGVVVEPPRGGQPLYPVIMSAE